MKHHVDKVAAICYYHLRRLRQIRRRVGQEVTTRLVLAMIISRLDYCNAALAGLPEATVAPPQRVQNSAALIFKLSSREHVTSCLLYSCTGLLPVRCRVQFKLCCVALCTQFSKGRVRRIWSTSLSLLVPAVHVVPASVPRRRPTTRCRGCAQSSLNVRSHMHDLLHDGTDCLKICAPWPTQLNFGNSWKLTFSLQPITFTDIWHRRFDVLCFMTAVMHLCP